MSGLGLKLALALAFVVALIWALQRVARRWGAVMAPERALQIRILSQRPLGPRLSLAVVQVMDRTLVLGISPQGIRTVADLGDARAACTPVVTASAVANPASALAAPVPPAREPIGCVAEPAAIDCGDGSDAAGASFEAELASRLAALQSRCASIEEMASKESESIEASGSVRMMEPALERECA